MWTTIAVLVFVFVAVAMGIGPRHCLADDVQAQALELSDHAFAMLDAINAVSASTKAGPILAPAASLAGDAQTLSTALGAHDNAAASIAMAAILSDRDKIEAAAKIAGGQYPKQWTFIREKIAALEKQVPASRGSGSIARSDAPVSHASGSPPPAGEKMPDAPKIAIASRVFKAGAVRVKGYLEGTDLKSAGIYDGDTKSRDIDVASVPGEQRLNFEFSIEQPSPTQSIRVTDSYGREAQAMVAPDPAGVGAMRGSEELIEVDPGAAASPGEAGPLAESPPAAAGPAVRNNTAEIARPGDALSPSQRHINSASSLGALTNVRINVIDTGAVMSAPGMVEVAGQIAGRGVRRAGVYVNGRLARPIAISASGNSVFDLTFPMPAGSTATIRAYGNGNDFVEVSVDAAGAGAGMTEYRNSAMYPPYGAYPPNIPWYDRLFH
ncbi:hypothetical protein [Candidatus Binatus soli]|jgi:hypothetical protein|uniref:hypothetical protein n=1 Tax=Candidatus Binatus soli TaxID=1953413 RepID=UPI003D114C9A